MAPDELTPSRSAVPCSCHPQCPPTRRGHKLCWAGTVPGDLRVRNLEATLRLSKDILHKENRRVSVSTHYRQLLSWLGFANGCSRLVEHRESQFKGSVSQSCLEKPVPSFLEALYCREPKSRMQECKQYIQNSAVLDTVFLRKYTLDYMHTHT